MEDSVICGSALRRKFTAWEIKLGIWIPEVALKAFMVHFHRSAETTSTLEGCCTLELVALALSDAMAEASNTILLTIHLPNLKHLEKLVINASLEYASFCMKIDGASKLGHTASHCLMSSGSPSFEKDTQGSSISDHVANKDTNRNTAACKGGHLYHSYMISCNCRFPSGFSGKKCLQ
ncbi:hypothetical protein SLA2020_412050 [Shorea laevis]